MLLSLQPRRQPSRAMLLLSPLLAAALTLGSGALLFALLGHAPLAVLHTLLVAPVSDFYGVCELLIKALPILLCAFGLAVAYQARVWNIGAEGQLLIGALAGSALAVNIIGWDSPWALACVLATGVLGGAESHADESFENGLLEYPQYTRPQSWEGRDIPAVLTSGDHGKVEKWRRAESEALTRARRPDLLK